MPRKGRLDEIFSKAIYADDPEKYFVSYRDFENIVEVSLPEFLKISESFDTIPQSRIFRVRKEDKILYRKAGT